MPAIEFREVRKAYGQQTVVPGLSLSIPDGCFAVMLGPSGCGKSTLLRLLAGLERVNAGHILIGGREVQHLAPSARGCAMVFQNYALYPHMTVADNIGYGLKLSGAPRLQRQARIDQVAQLLGLTELLARLPSQLSGGQRQRVAIGRAIAREPGVLLFDEPLSNLDAQLRGETRIELAALHRRIGATSLFVTHDQVEAMTLADLVVVMNRGQIEQVAPPVEIYANPATLFVAQFVGSPTLNLFAARAQGGQVALTASGDSVGHAAGVSGDLQIGVRPEHVQLADAGWPAVVRGIERHGRETVHLLETANGRVVTVQPEHSSTSRVGEAVHVSVDWRRALAFSATSGLRERSFKPVLS